MEPQLLVSGAISKKNKCSGAISDPLKEAAVLCIIFSRAVEEIPNLLHLRAFRIPLLRNECLPCEFAQTSRPCSLPALGLRCQPIILKNSIQNKPRSLQLLHFATKWRTAHACDSR